MRHQVTRVRHELRRRRLEVRRAEEVTPLVRRILLGGKEIDGFSSPGPDDHVKLFMPGPAGTERRDYTSRFHDPANGELTIDFAMHVGGPATAWFLTAVPGDTLEVAGPRGSTLVPADFDWWLLVGDETALPAISRRVEELPAETPVISLVAVTIAAEEQRCVAAADHRPVWVHRDCRGGCRFRATARRIARVLLSAGRRLRLDRRRGERRPRRSGTHSRRDEAPARVDQG